jgi:hypothetical protein
MQQHISQEKIKTQTVEQTTITKPIVTNPTEIAKEIEKQRALQAEERRI